MAVLVRTKNAFFVDHKQFIDSALIGTPMTTVGYVSTPNVVFEFDSKFFDIHNSFVTDSRFSKLNGNAESETTVPSESNPFTDKPRKRKRKHPLTNNFSVSLHEEIQKYVSKALDEIREVSREIKIFGTACPEYTNNKEARRMAAQVQELSMQFSKYSDLEHDLEKDATLSITSLNDSCRALPKTPTNVYFSYTGKRPSLVQCHGKNFLLPSRCKFVLSDVRHIHQLVDLGFSYDFIVLDPPWINKSVKRKKGYPTLKKNHLLNIPINRLAKEMCIVAVWVTNNDTLLTYVKEELFPAWKLHFSAIWHWVKVTTLGKLVCDINSHHKKPYEHIVIGQKVMGNTPLEIPNHKIICSVPSSIHSHKPPLQDVFRSYLNPNAVDFLEIFARYLLPEWTSWGYEPLLLQCQDFYNALPAD